MTTDDLSTVIAGLRTEYLHCRDTGHLWKPWKAKLLPRKRGAEDSLRCQRCGMVRHRVLDSRGHVIANSYTQPDGYQLKGFGYLTADDRGMIRLASIADTAKTVAE